MGKEGRADWIDLKQRWRFSSCCESPGVLLGCRCRLIRSEVGPRFGFSLCTSPLVKSWVWKLTCCLEEKRDFMWLDQKILIYRSTFLVTFSCFSELNVGVEQLLKCANLENYVPCWDLRYEKSHSRVDSSIIPHRFCVSCSVNLGVPWSLQK